MPAPDERLAAMTMMREARAIMERFGLSIPVLHIEFAIDRLQRSIESSERALSPTHRATAE